MTQEKKFDIFDPALLPERIVTADEMKLAFGIKDDALRDAWAENDKLPPPAEQRWFKSASIWYVGQLRAWFRSRADAAVRRDKKAQKTSVAEPAAR